MAVRITIFEKFRALQLVTMISGLAVVVGCGSSGSGGGATSSSQSQPTSTVQNSQVGTSASVAEMDIGDLYVVPMTDSSGSIDFTGAPSTAQYLMIVQAANPSGSSASVALGNEAVPESLTKSLGIATNEISTEVGEALDLTLRVAEEDLAAEGLQPVAKVNKSSSAGKTLSQVTSVGDQEEFRVLASLSTSGSYSTVTATIVCVTDHLTVALDNSDSGVFTSEEIQDLCTRAEDAAASDISILGEPSDVNGDGRITYLWTNRVNQLGAQGGGIVTGFFYAADLYPRTDSNPVSNEQEIVFALVPDPTGAYGSAISKSFAINNLLTAVLPHEIQHAISYNQHVLLRGGSTEKTWLNEAISHNMECVTGYCQENPSRVSLYLAAPASTALVSGGSANLKQRGASFLFIRYLYEQSVDGAAFLNRLVATDITDVANIERAFAGTDTSFDQFEEFFFRWAIAVGMTDSGIVSDPKFTFKARSYNSTTGQWDGVCLQCDTEDGRGTTLTGPKVASYTGSTAMTLAATGTAYYSVTPQSTPLAISAASTANLQAVLVRTK